MLQFYFLNASLHSGCNKLNLKFLNSYLKNSKFLLPKPNCDPKRFGLVLGLDSALRLGLGLAMSKSYVHGLVQD